METRMCHSPTKKIRLAVRVVVLVCSLAPVAQQCRQTLMTCSAACWAPPPPRSAQKLLHQQQPLDQLKPLTMSWPLLWQRPWEGVQGGTSWRARQTTRAAATTWTSGDTCPPAPPLQLRHAATKRRRGLAVSQVGATSPRQLSPRMQRLPGTRRLGQPPLPRPPLLRGTRHLGRPRPRLQQQLLLRTTTSGTPTRRGGQRALRGGSHRPL